MGEFLIEVHKQRPSGNGILSSSLTLNLTQGSGSYLYNNVGLNSDAVDAYRRWLGLGDYYPGATSENGIIDDGITVVRRAAWTRGDVTARNSDTQFEFTVGLIGQLGGGSAPNTERVDSGSWQVAAIVSGSRTFIDRMQVGNQLRLYDSTNDADVALVEIAGSSAVENPDGTATVTVDSASSPSTPNATGTLPTNVTDANVTFGYTDWSS